MPSNPRRNFNLFDLGLFFVLSFLTHFFNLSFPKTVVFDEAHFGLYASKYLSHQYYFDIHPPLGKMVLGLFAFLAKLKPGFDFAVNTPYGESNFLILRFLPAFFGFLFVILVYLFVIELGFSRRAAFLSGFLVLFDNALTVQSQLILLDIILLFFIFLSLYLFLLARRFLPLSKKWFLFNFFCGLSLAAAISIKWTGLGVLGIVWVLSILQDRVFSRPKREILARVFFLFILPLLVYFLIFALHFHLLPLACSENCGYVLDRHLLTPKDSFYNTPPSGNLIDKFIETNRLMLLANLGAGSCFVQSDWFSWPFMIGTIRYFTGIEADKVSFVSFAGNPIVWLLGLVGILGYFYSVTRNYFYKFRLSLPSSFYSPNCLFLVLGYLTYFLPFASIERFMLMYHYLPALSFSIIFFALFFEGFLTLAFNPSTENRLFFSQKKANVLFSAVLISVFLGFLFVSPFTYGIYLILS